MSVEEIKARITQLKEMEMDLLMRISLEEQAIFNKMNRLNAINQQLQLISSRGVLGMLASIETVDKLMKEREKLVSEIQREQQQVAVYRQGISRIEDEILRLRYSLASAQRIPTGTEALGYIITERQRIDEINRLLEELKLINRGLIPNGKNREAIIRRLRELGYQI